MAEAPPFSDRETLEAWLENQPVDWSRVIALRAALRVLPLISGPRIEELDGELRVHLLLTTFRACLTAEVRAENPDEPIEAIAYATLTASKAATEAANAAVTAYAIAYAANATYATFVSAANTANVSAANAANAAANATAVVDNANANANADADANVIDAAFTALTTATAAAAADDAFGGAAIIWRSVSTDASLLAAGESAGKLLRRPLWLDGGAPKWSDEAWNDLKTSPLNLAAGFAPWIAWWEALLPREKHAAPRNNFGKELALKIVTQSDEWWGRDPAAVNKDIADWLSSRAPPMDKATKAKEIARLNNAYFAARAKTASQSVEKHLRTGGKGAGGGGAEWVDALAELDRLLGGRK